MGSSNQPYKAHQGMPKCIRLMMPAEPESGQLYLGKDGDLKTPLHSIKVNEITDLISSISEILIENWYGCVHHSKKPPYEPNFYIVSMVFAKIS